MRMGDAPYSKILKCPPTGNALELKQWAVAGSTGSQWFAVPHEGGRPYQDQRTKGPKDQI